MFRPEDFAELLLRLRPIGLALRTTPAAPNRKGNIFFMARPPLLCEEGNLFSDAGFVKYVDALNRGEYDRCATVWYQNDLRNHNGIDYRGRIGPHTWRPSMASPSNSRH